MWRGKVQVLKSLVRRSMTHTRQSTSVLGCGIFHFQNIFECTCVRYNIVLFAVFLILIFWVSQLINQKNATTFCIFRKYLLCCKTFKLAPTKFAHRSTYQLMSQCCPLLPRYTPHWSSTDISLVCVHPHEWSGTVMDCLLCNLVVLLIVECNAVI